MDIGCLIVVARLKLAAMCVCTELRSILPNQPKIVQSTDLQSTTIVGLNHKTLLDIGKRENVTCLGGLVGPRNITRSS